MTSVLDYVKTLSDVEPTLTRFQEMVSKYTFMQQNVDRRAAGLREKLPEMKKSLDVVKFLARKRSDSGAATSDLSDTDDVDTDDSTIETTFELQDTLYATARLRPRSIAEVYLWLGANVMVAYPLDEAEALLAAKLAKARESLRAAEDDLEFLRVQITTLEVALARVHNWDVGEKRRLRAEGKSVPGDADAHGEAEKDK